MSPFAAFAFVPLWAATLAVGFTAIRLGRRSGRVLAMPSLLLGAWVTGLVLLESPGHEHLAERVLPFGMLLAGAFVHAAAALSGGSPRVVVIAWVASAIVALVGFVAPQWLYGPGARGPGPLFWPLGALSAVGSLAVKAWLWKLVREAPTAVRSQRIALFVANLCCALGGGGVIALHVTGLAPISVAAPMLLVGVVACAVAIWSAEDARGRENLAQGFALAIVTSAISGIALVLFYAALPRLVPGGNALSWWGVFFLFFASLPLDPFRQAFIDRVAGALFSRPIAVGALTAEIEKHETRADQAERLAELGRMASAVAHEVRNPLGVILAEAKLLEREGANAESVEALRAQVDRARRFLDELLRYATPRPLVVSHFDVHDATRRATELARKAIGAATVVTPEATGPSIEADPHAFEDVLTNLVTNALIATEAREGAGVRVRVENGGDVVVIAIEDDGPGVPPAIEARLFEAFTTGRGRDAKRPGTGLGLALCARLVQRHGGTIVHERPSAGGARFVVRWPKRPAA